jgi:DNA-binding CsgD family transcriptional regulator
LSEAERKVGQLISAGQTNQAAARTLGLSPNTVGTHLRSIFAKLDVRSRVQLANAWNEHTATERLPEHSRRELSGRRDRIVSG